MRRRAFSILGTCLTIAGATPLLAAAQTMPDKLQPDNTPAYQEHDTTSPASATAARNRALNTVPGKVSSGKQPAHSRPNGLGMDAGAGSMTGKSQ
jgi:hypothetical protein